MRRQQTMAADRVSSSSRQLQQTASADNAAAAALSHSSHAQVNLPFTCAGAMAPGAHQCACTLVLWACHPCQLGSRSPQVRAACLLQVPLPVHVMVGVGRSTLYSPLAQTAVQVVPAGSLPAASRSLVQFQEGLAPPVTCGRALKEHAGGAAAGMTSTAHQVL